MDNVTRFNADNRFSIIPHWVIFSGISSGGIHLYAVLMKYADNETGQAFPSRQTLARDLSKTLRTVDSYIKELTSIGALKVTQRKRRDSNENYSNLYTLITAKPNAEPVPDVLEVDPVQSVAGGGVASCAVTIPSLSIPTSVTSSLRDDQIKESDTGEQVRPAKNPQGINSTGLTKKQRDPMRNQLVKIGHLIKDGASFYDESVQDEWYDFGRLVEATFPDHFDATGLADLIDNLKSSVDAKCVDPLVAGKRLTSIINTGLKY